jgi:hypothetical protein
MPLDRKAMAAPPVTPPRTCAAHVQAMAGIRAAVPPARASGPFASPSALQARQANAPQRPVAAHVQAALNRTQPTAPPSRQAPPAQPALRPSPVRQPPIPPLPARVAQPAQPSVQPSAPPARLSVPVPPARPLSRPAVQRLSPPVLPGDRAKTVQRKVKVHITGTMPGQKKMVIDDVQVYDRTYPNEKKILGVKQKNDHRNHTITWDLYMASFENRYKKKTVETMAEALGCEETVAAVQEAYARQIDEVAREEMVLYYGNGKKNMAGGRKYRAAKNQYRKSHDAKHAKIRYGSKLTKVESRRHLEAKRKFAETALDFPSEFDYDHSKRKRRRLHEKLTEERNTLIKEGYDTDSEGLSETDD